MGRVMENITILLDNHYKDEQPVDENNADKYVKMLLEENSDLQKTVKTLVEKADILKGL